MDLRLIARQYFAKLPSWPIKLLKKLLFALLCGNTKYVLVSVFCFILIIFTRHKQSNIEFFLGEPVSQKVFIVKKEAVVPEVVVRHIQEYSDIKEKKNKVPNSRKSCSDFPSLLVGNMTINPNITPSTRDLESLVGPSLMKGGCFTPTECQPRQKVAIIIPFKDRDAHLKTLLYYLHPMLMRQRSHYCIYVVEQYDEGQFNKAMIMNAGFVEAMKLNSYDCIIFHDVDMLPENDENYYGCGSEPRHLSPAIDKFKYKPHYGTDFGGVTAITPEQYKKANGHSNQFWGWGGEDNDMEYRIRSNGMKIIPSPLEVGRYKMIFHYHPWKFKAGNFPFNMNETAIARAKTDGLNDLSYRMLGKNLKKTYTKLIIDIRRIDVTNITMYMDGKKAMDIDIAIADCQYIPYEGKYLDFKMKLGDYKEAIPYRPKSSAVTQYVPDEVKAKIPSSSNKTTFSTVDTKENAIKLCELLQPECQGIQRESNNKFSLKSGGIPRNLIFTTSSKAVNLPNGKIGYKASKSKSYHFPSQTAYLRYCPGISGSIKKYDKIIPLDLNLNRSKAQHNYSFEIHCSVLLQPTKFLYYEDKKILEGTEKIQEAFYTLHWPNPGPAPNFKLPDTPRNYVFKTRNISLPNIPGAYGIESRILSRDLHPYFQWNWWIDISSNDSVQDAQLRDAYAKELKKARAKEQAIKKRNLKISRQKRREYLFEKNMAKLKGKAFEVIPDFEYQNKIPDNLAEKLRSANKELQFQFFPENRIKFETMKKKENRSKKKSFHLHLPPNLKQKKS